MNKRFDLSYLLIVPWLLRVSSPWFQYRTKAIVAIPLFLLWCLFQIAKPSRFNLRFWFNVRRMYFIFCAAIVVFFGLLPLLAGGIDLSSIGRGALSRRTIVQMLTLLAFAFIVYWSLVKHKFKELRFLGVIVLLSFLQMGIVTLLFGDIVSDGASRIMVAIGNGELDSGSVDASLAESAQIIGTYGLGNYDFAYLAAFLTPAFLFSSLKIPSKLLKTLCLLSALGATVVVYKGGLQTPVFVLILGIFLFILALLFKLQKSLVALGCLAMLGIGLFIVQPKVYIFLSPVLRAASEMTEDPNYKLHLDTLAEAAEGDKLTYAYKRYRLQVRSWEGFCEHPFLGGGPNARSGGHSELLDTMSAYGLTGLFCMVFLLTRFYKFNAALGYAVLGKQWLVMVSAYIGLFIFTSITNPVDMLSPVAILLFPALALSYPGAPLGGSVGKEENG